MLINSPPANKVSSHFPEIQNLEFFIAGGFKAVYFGLVNGKKEALKLVHIPSSANLSDEERLELINENKRRVIREITILEKCVTPHIVKLGTIKTKETIIDEYNFVAYSEEYLEGESLDALIKKKYQPEEKELRKLCLDMLQAIKELWQSHKVVHRDIKPLNVIKHNNPKRGFILIDLGIAFAIYETALTVNPANVMGSLYYLPPETFQANFRENLDYKYDLYDVGLTVYEFASNINPFWRKGEIQGQTLNRILKDKPIPLNELRPDLNEDFCNIIDQLLKKIPAIRPAQIDRLISFMESAL